MICTLREMIGNDSKNFGAQYKFRQLVLEDFCKEGFRPV
jgi:hypothetical protein